MMSSHPSKLREIAARAKATSRFMTSLRQRTKFRTLLKAIPCHLLDALEFALELVERHAGRQAHTQIAVCRRLFPDRLAPLAVVLGFAVGNDISPLGFSSGRSCYLLGLDSLGFQL